MKKLNKKVLNGSLVVLLALGLGGCAASSSAPATHKTHEATSAQVVKQSSHKKATNKTAKATTNKQSASTSSSSSSAASSSAVASTKSANAAATASSSSSSSASAVVASSHQTASQVSNVSQSQKQLGLGDVASWTDAEGTTHHIDSDGMDRYTTKGSSQVQYQDFSGELPSNAVISHQN